MICPWITKIKTLLLDMSQLRKINIIILIEMIVINPLQIFFRRNFMELLKEFANVINDKYSP